MEFNLPHQQNENQGLLILPALAWLMMEFEGLPDVWLEVLGQ